MKISRSRFASLPLLLIGIALPAMAGITGERPVSTPVYAPVTDLGGIAIASDGDQFLAVWTDSRDSESHYASRIDRDGTVLDPPGIFIASIPGSFAGVAWNGDSYVVVWSGSNRIMAARIASNGAIIDPPRILFDGGGVFTDARQIAANANIIVIATNRGYLVADHELRILDSGSLASETSVYRTGLDGFTLLALNRSLRLDGAGHLVSSGTLAGPVGGTISCHSQDCIRVVGNGTTQHLTVAQFDPSSLTSGNALELAIIDRPLALVPVSSGYLLLTSDETLQRFDMAGRPSGPPASPCCSRVTLVAGASNGSDAAILRRSSTLTVSMMTANGASGEPHTLATSANAQRTPSIASSGSNYLVAWSERDGVYAGRLSHNGDPLDGRGLFLGKSSGTDAFSSMASVAFDGAIYLVAISTSLYTTMDPIGTIRVARVDPVTGMTQNDRTVCGYDMRLASNGSKTVAVWADCTGRIVAGFLEGNGLSASVPLTAAISTDTASWPATRAHPALAWNGTEWLVTWEEQAFVLYSSPFVYGVFYTYAIQGTRLSPALTPLDAQPIALTAPTQSRLESSHIASDGHDFLALWQQGISIHTRRISASGVPSEDQTIAGIRSPLDLVWDGASYSMAFASFNTSSYLPIDVALMHLRPSGEPTDSLIISATPDDERSATLLPIGVGGVLAAYTRVAHEALYGGVERVFVAIPRPARSRAAR